MTHRRIALLTAAAAVLAVAGCSSSGKTEASHRSTAAHTAPAGNPASTPATSASSTSGAASTPAPTTTLSTDQCLELAEAQLGVATATKADEARKAADIVEKYSPPADVKNVVEHFVTTIGVQFDDPQAAAGTAALKAWVDRVCPT